MKIIKTLQVNQFGNVEPKRSGDRIKDQSDIERTELGLKNKKKKNMKKKIAQNTEIATVYDENQAINYVEYLEDNNIPSFTSRAYKGIHILVPLEYEDKANNLIDSVIFDNDYKYKNEIPSEEEWEDELRRIKSNSKNKIKISKDFKILIKKGKLYDNS